MPATKKTLTTKPAAKKAAPTKKTAAVKKPAAEVSPKGKTTKAAGFTGGKIPAGAPVHVISEDARPSSGQRLFAHTHVALSALGMLDPSRPAVPKQFVLTLMGQRAVNYHTRKQNFESAPNNGLRLSVTGRNWFNGRFNEGKVDVGLANAFVTLLTTGKAPASTGVAQANVYGTRLGAE